MYLKYFSQNTCCIFRILTTKYRIQCMQSCTTTIRLVHCEVTNHNVTRSTKYVTAQNAFRQWILFCEAENSVRDIHPAAPDRKITGSYNVSDINPPLMNALNLLFMVALWNRADHYIFILWFLLSSVFFPRLISAVAEWMSAILAHGVALVRI